MSLDDQLSMLRKMWASLFVAPAFFVVAALLEPPKPTEAVSILLLGLAAVVVAAVSFVVPRLALKSRLAQKKIAVTETGMLADPEAALDIVMKAYPSSMMAGMGPAIAVAMLGFMAMHLDKVTWEAAPFFLASWLLMALQFPTREKAIAALEAASGAKYKSTIAIASR